MGTQTERNPPGVRETCASLSAYFLRFPNPFRCFCLHRVDRDSGCEGGRARAMPCQFLSNLRPGGLRPCFWRDPPLADDLEFAIVAPIRLRDWRRRYRATFNAHVETSSEVPGARGVSRTGSKRRGQLCPGRENPCLHARPLALRLCEPDRHRERGGDRLWRRRTWKPSAGEAGPEISERAWCLNAASHRLCHAPRRAAIERTCSIVLNSSRILWRGLAVIRQWLTRLQFVLKTPWFCNSRTEGGTFKKRCSNCQIEHGLVTN